MKTFKAIVCEVMTRQKTVTVRAHSLVEAKEEISNGFFKEVATSQVHAVESLLIIVEDTND